MSHRVWAAAVPAIALTMFAGSALAAPSQGETLFKQRCGTCHTVEVGGPTKMGPSLKGVMGRKAGTAPGFAFSAALKNSGIVWNATNMDAYVAKPTATVPGTKMMVGMPGDPAQRAAVISYLAAQK